MAPSLSHPLCSKFLSKTYPQLVQVHPTVNSLAGLVRDFENGLCEGIVDAAPFVLGLSNARIDLDPTAARKYCVEGRPELMMPADSGNPIPWGLVDMAVGVRNHESTREFRHAVSYWITKMRACNWNDRNDDGQCHLGGNLDRLYHEHVDAPRGGTNCGAGPGVFGQWDQDGGSDGLEPTAFMPLFGALCLGALVVVVATLYDHRRTVRSLCARRATNLIDVASSQVPGFFDGGKVHVARLKAEWWDRSTLRKALLKPMEEVRDIRDDDRRCCRRPLTAPPSTTAEPTSSVSARSSGAPPCTRPRWTSKRTRPTRAAVPSWSSRR